MILRNCLAICILSNFWLPEVNADPKNYTGYAVYKVTPTEPFHLEIIEDITKERSYDLWTTSSQMGLPTIVMVPPKDQYTFTRLVDSNNISYSVSIPNIQKILDEENRQQRFGGRVGKAWTAKQKTGIAFTKYYRHAEINRYLRYLNKKYPQFTEIINIGKSFEGRDLNVIKISTANNPNKTKPAILVTGGIHAREWISPAQVLYVIHQLVEHHDDTKDVTDDIDWYLLPVINPDGYEYSHQKDRFWRKTRSKVGDCIGVDANRNFAFAWRPLDNCNSDVYPGVTSFTEPETQALAKFANKIKRQLKAYLDFHSFGNYILYPWGYKLSVAKRDNELKTVARQLNGALNNEYTIGTPPDILYPAFGSNLDYFKGALKTRYVYCIELPGDGEGLNGFVVQPNRMKRILHPVFEGVRELAHIVHDKYAI